MCCDIGIIFVFKDIVVACIGAVVDTKDIVVVPNSIVVVVLTVSMSLSKTLWSFVTITVSFLKASLSFTKRCGFYKNVDVVVVNVLSFPGVFYYCF